MTDSMQFGPEWLRNLSQQDSEDDNTMVMPKYQLAEHRYGREEMLALFDKSISSPNPLHVIDGLFVEKTQLPLALIQMTEEETRVWNSSAINDNSTRGLMKNIPGGMENSNTPTVVTARGRGIPLDRGRGRGSRAPYHYNSRNYSDEGAENAHSSTTFGRPRMFDRNQSHNNERNWVERNGTAENNDWNGYNNSVENGLSTSPRKDFGISLRATIFREDTNWRKRPTKDDDGWRSTRHGRGYSNWREGAERDREKDKENDSQEYGKDRRWVSRVVNMHSHSNRRDSENREDCLPEWATENPSECGGTFDSAGAFHNINSDEEDVVITRKERFIHDAQKSDQKDLADSTEVKHETSREEIPLTQEKKKQEMRVHSSERVGKYNEETSIACKGNKSDWKPSSSRMLVDKKSQLFSSPPRTHESQKMTHQISDEFNEDHSAAIESQVEASKGPSLQTSSKHQVPLERETFLQLHQKLKYPEITNNSPISNFNYKSMDSNRSIISTNPNVSPNISAYNTGVSLKKKVPVNTNDGFSSSIPLINQNDSTETSKSSSMSFSATSHVRSKGKEEELDGIVNDVVSKIMAAEEEEKKKLKEVELMNKWFYRDPQGIVQGPFTNFEMAEWYRLGYFHDKSLIVRRACETNYYSLHDLVSYFGAIPFETVTLQNYNKYVRLPVPSFQLGSFPNMIPTPASPSAPDETLLLQHFQSPYELYARQQLLAAKKRQLTHNQEGLKSLLDHQRLLTQHLNNPDDVTTSTQSSIPIIAGYVPSSRPPTIPSIDPNLVMLFNQMQVQQQHFIQPQQQQQLQQLQQQHPQPPPLQHSTSKVGKSDSMQQQFGLISNPDHPFQQLVHKISTISTANQLPLSQGQAGCVQSTLPILSGESKMQSESSTSCREDGQPTTAIHNLLKQLGVSVEKQSKPVESMWGSNSAPLLPMLNNEIFNIQHWCSQAGKLGPSNVTTANVSNTFNTNTNSNLNSGLWNSDGLPTTTVMKTEQDIIESFMKSQQKIEDPKTTNNNTKIKRQEEIKIQIETKLKEEELKKAKLEEEKRKKKQAEEEKLRRIEEEQRRKAIEDAKRKEEERKRKEEKRKRDENKEQQCQPEERKKLEQNRKEVEELRQAANDSKELERKQVNALKRLKDQRMAAATVMTTTMSNNNNNNITSSNSKLSHKSGLSSLSNQELKVLGLPEMRKANNNSKQLSKSQSSQREEQRQVNKEVTSNDSAASLPKQVAKSKSIPSVPTAQSSKQASEMEKKEKKKKEKSASSTNAWADQKKIPNVKSLAEIQAEEQKILAKQIEKDKQERLLQQQNAMAAAEAAKEVTTSNKWGSQNQPWKSGWTSVVSSSYSCSTSSSPTANETLTTSKSVWNEQTRVAACYSASETTLASTFDNSSRTQTSISNPTCAAKSCNVNGTSKPITSAGNTSSTAGNNAGAKNKSKKDDSTNKRGTALAQTLLRKNELLKWGVEALSSLKPSVDVPTFIAFLGEVESPNDVMEYVTDYLGDGKEIKNFVKQFLEKRSVVTSVNIVKSSSTTIGAMTSNANVRKLKKKNEESSKANSTAKSGAKHSLTKTDSAEFTEVKGKSKKGKKKATLRVDSTMLSFNVTAAPDRINIGDRDYGEDVY